MFESARDYWLYPAIAVAALAFGYGCVSAVQSLSPAPNEAANAQVFKPAAIVRYQQTGSPPLRAMDKRSLARAIQSELARVGCYDGTLNGLWTQATRTAMSSFVENANGRLPTDGPDQALLSLVQAHTGAGACQANPGAASAGVALVAAPRSHYRTEGEAPSAPTPVAAVQQRAPDLPPPSAPVKTAEVQSTPSTDSEAAAEARKIMTATPPSAILAKVEPLDQSVAPTAPQSVAPVDAEPEPSEAERAAKPRRRTARRKLRRNSSKPPKFVRSLVRNVNKTLSSFGF